MSNKPKLIITCGVSCSGKSTYAKSLLQEDTSWIELNRDEMRWELFTNNTLDWNLYTFNKQNERAVTERINERFVLAVKDNKNIVVSNTHLNKADHEFWRKKAEENGYEFEVKYFDVTLTEAIKRDSKRKHLSVGKDVIFKQWQKWLDISGFKRYVHRPELPKAIIVDIDGTIALVDGRSHYDYSEAVLTDKPRKDVIELVNGMASIQGAHIVYLSGRDVICYEHTVKWLHSNNIDFTTLLMRPAGDTRCDSIVKEELFREFIEPTYNVIAAFDDRQRIIRKWKDIGIPLVIDVSVGYIEF